MKKTIKKFQNDLNTGNKRLYSNYNIFKELKERMHKLETVEYLRGLKL